MAQLVGRLTALKVDRLKKPGMYADGGGLYLQVTGDGDKRVAKSWIYRFMLGGKERYMGLGSLSALGLADARIKTAECRRIRLEGANPIDTRKADRARAALEAARAVTFETCAEQHIKAHRAAWRNEKHAAQWESTLKTYAYPIIGSAPVQGVDTALVMKILEPIWSTKPETAGRVRGRIEAVLDWATARGFRQGENPARWRGHLDKLLPARGKVRKVQHHPALPYEELPSFMVDLRDREGIAARALEFLILTATRTGEVIGARSVEIRNKVWTIPAERMKGGKEHRIPLSSQALAIAEKMKREHGGEYLFAGGKAKEPLSNMAMLVLLRRIGRSDLTAHGFRSTFRDWVAERTNYPTEVAEMALAHAIENKVEAAYRRGDLFNKRVDLMREWADFCLREASDRGKVVEMPKQHA